MKRAQNLKAVKPIRWIVGIDEVGRGPLAGPVLLGFVKIEAEKAKEVFKMFKCLNLNDSKKISAQKRLAIMQYALKCREQGLIKFVTARAYPQMIDENGISKSIKRCIASGLRRLECIPSKTKILLDGSLYAPTHFIYQETIIRGDSKEPIISLASVIAKVTRDTYMEEISERFPSYAFYQHKGYGTLQHRKALKAYGLSTMHRKSFCKNFI